LLAANIAQQFPHLVGAIYAEVPYVDVLRTTSNPELPLTQLEYDEFGDPIKRPEDYSALQLISPVDTVPLRQSKQLPLVLVRTGVNDAQVLPYEALKWAKKLRALGWNVLVGIDTDGGHFAAESVMDSQHAEDISIIDNYFAAVKPSKTRKLRSHVSRGTKRRRTSSRKH
jgi:protease II